MSPIFSIIIPCYNQAQFLPDAILSVLNQSFDSWECIVVNDGSPDNTSEIVRQFSEKDSRIVLLEKENGGLSSARNTGIRAAKGTYILPLDSDDKIGPDYLKLAYRRFESHPETKLVYCRARLFGDAHNQWFLPEFKWEQFIFNNCIFCSCIYRKSEYEKTEGYNETMNIGMEDWDFLLSLLKPDDVVYRIPRTLFFYRIRTNATMTANSHRNKYKIIDAILDSHKDIYRQYLYNRMELLNPTSSPTSHIEKKVGHALTKPVRAFSLWRHKHALYK